MQLVDVVGIVTGGAAGFGQSFAAAILEAGGRVVITDINEAALQKTGESFVAQYSAERVAWIQQDVTDRASFHRVFEFAAQHFDRAVNLLVNNAGVHGEGLLLAENETLEWESVIEINLIAPTRGTQVAIQQMREHLQGQPGVIINVASGAGIVPLTPAPEYTISKHGVVGLTRVCAGQKEACNVRVVALCPTFAATAMSEYAAEAMPEAIAALGGVMPVDQVTKGFVKVLQEDDNAGQCLWISPAATMYVPFPLSGAA